LAFTGVGGVGGPGIPANHNLTFAFAGTASRQLLVNLVALTDGNTGVRADAQVQWIVPRPASERIPAGVRAVDITRGVPGRPPAIAVTVSAPAEVSVIVAMIDRLPIVQPGGWNCPAQFAGSPRVQFVLRSAGGAVLARAAEDADVVEPTTPCDPLSFSVGGHPETALLHGASFLHAVARLTRARLAVGRP
jgi:hypothetical protein